MNKEKGNIKKVINTNQRAEECNTVLKISIEGFHRRLDQVKQGSTDLKTGQWNSIRGAKRKKSEVS